MSFLTENAENVMKSTSYAVKKRQRELYRDRAKEFYDTKMG